MSLMNLNINGILPGSTHHSDMHADGGVGSLVPPISGTITGLGVHIPSGFEGSGATIDLSVMVDDVETSVFTVSACSSEITKHVTFSAIAFSAGSRIELKAGASPDLNGGPIHLIGTLAMT